MRLAVIGATQGIGLELTRMALEAGHEVTVLVRNPAKLSLAHAGLRVLTGDARDLASAAAVSAGQDAVCLCIGVPPTRKPVQVFSQSTEAFLAALGEGPAPKLVVVTGLGTGDSKGHGGFFYDKLLNPLLLGTIYADKDRQEDLLKASSAEWLIVRPGFLTDGPRTGQYRVVNDLTGITAGKISRRDVADFILNQVAHPTQFHQTPLLTY
jgi:putative NADH-flavin reductase